jgi:O-antigen chain-terminating methyltransferase
LRTITDRFERLNNDILLELKNKIKQHIETLKNHVESLQNKQYEILSSVEELKNEQAALHSSIERLMNKLGDRETIIEDEGHHLDTLYVSLENQFRGTSEDIKKKLKVYLPYIKKTNAGSKDLPVLDIGCGRGEWLDLLKEESLHARGVDKNSIHVKLCQGRGLDVVEEDILRYLKKLGDKSIGAVTGFHIIEHLPFGALIELLDETVRVLSPGGIAIYETPNPQNILVGSCNFYLDPTHRKPLVSQTMKFLAEARGLSNVDIVNLHPLPDAYILTETELARKFNEYFYGPMDYALIGYKL